MTGDARTGELAMGERGFASPPNPSSLRSADARGASAMAITALVLGIAAWIVGGIFFSVPGWIVAKMELNRIERGESPEAGKAFAQVGYWASIVYTVLFLALACLGGVAGLLFVFLGTGSPR